MIRSPIHRVLSTVMTHRVRALLMGGQACVFYGAAEFSRDTDLLLLADTPNLDRLKSALSELQAELIAIPPLGLKYLRRGHAVHFRCAHPEATNMRIDVMSVLRCVDPFEKVWSRRTTVEDKDGTVYELLSLPDLVRAKKTQRDKDWPMVRRLVEADYFANRESPNEAHLWFWLRELRTPELLIEVAARNCELCARLSSDRPLLVYAVPGSEAGLHDALQEEERQEREKDRLYWKPLIQELEELRREQRQRTRD